MFTDTSNCLKITSYYSIICYIKTVTKYGIVSKVLMSVKTTLIPLLIGSLSLWLHLRLQLLAVTSFVYP